MFTYNKFINLSKPKSRLELIFESEEDFDFESVLNSIGDDDETETGNDNGIYTLDTANDNVTGDTIDVNSLISDDNEDDDVTGDTIDVNSLISDDNGDDDDGFNPTEEQIEDYINSLGEETDIGKIMPDDPDLKRLEDMLLQNISSNTPALKKPDELLEEEISTISNIIEYNINQDTSNTPLSLEQTIAIVRDSIEDKNFVDALEYHFNKEVIPLCEKHRVTFTDREKAELFTKLLYIYINPENENKTPEDIDKAEREMLYQFIKMNKKPITDEEIFAETLKGSAKELGWQIGCDIGIGVVSGAWSKYRSKKVYTAFLTRSLNTICNDIARNSVDELVKQSGVVLSKEATNELYKSARKNLVVEFKAYISSGGKKTFESALNFFNGEGVTKTFNYLSKTIQNMPETLINKTAKVAVKETIKKGVAKKATQVAVKETTKVVAKQGSATVGKSALKKTPIIGFFVGIGLGAMELWNNGFNARSFARAGAEVLSGAVATAPGIGTAASIGIDVALAGEEVYHELSKQKTEDEKENETNVYQPQPDNTSSEDFSEDFSELLKTI